MNKTLATGFLFIGSNIFIGFILLFFTNLYQDGNGTPEFFESFAGFGLFLAAVIWVISVILLLKEISPTE